MQQDEYDFELNSVHLGSPDVDSEDSGDALQYAYDPETIVSAYNPKDVENLSFIDPSQPGPSPAFYYDTQYEKPTRARLGHETDLFDEGSEETPEGDTAMDELVPDDESKSGCCGRKKKDDSGGSKKFGMWDGVVASCLLSIFGVIMFLRLPYVVGQAGIGQTILIILLSAVITLLTTLSMSAIATNGKIEGGGAYFMISRSLGPEIGGAIGILFSLGQAVAVSLYLIGFAETLTNKLREDWGGISIHPTDPLWDIRVWSIAALVLLLIMALIGVGWVIKIQLILLTGIMIIIFSVLLGSWIGPFEEFKRAACMVGITDFVPIVCATIDGMNTTMPPVVNGTLVANATTGMIAMQMNLDANYVDGYGFFEAFALYFPAATGIMAGANISGDLRNPGTDIPKGTIFSIIFSAIVYIILAIFIGGSVGREALYNNPTILEVVSVWGPLILIGVFAATLSSALAALVGAPRIFQAVCKDELFTGRCMTPFQRFFAKGREPSNDPIAGYFFTFVIAVGVNLIGDLNVVAPIISQFFLITYFLVNIACAASSITDAPGWRPSFRFYHPAVALIAAGLCAAVMFLSNWWSALIAVVVAALIFILLKWRTPDVNWGPTGHALRYNQVVTSVMHLRKIPYNEKVWRPHYLVLIKDREGDEPLMRFMRFLAHGGSLLLFGEVMVGEHNFREVLRDYKDAIQDPYLIRTWGEAKKRAGRTVIVQKKLKACYDATLATDVRLGVQSFLLASGIGKFKPNSSVFGYPESWATSSPKTQMDYVGMIRDSFEISNNIVVIRRPDAVDYKEVPMGTIDVWWLVDDGGFTLLLPWLLFSKTYWHHCKLRIFAVPGSSNARAVAQAASDLGNLVREFRIPAKVHVEIPEAITDAQLQELIDSSPVDFVPEAKERLRRYYLLQQMINKNCLEASLVCCTLPFPRDVLPATNWLAFMELVSGAAPQAPFVFLRGNQKNVLTLYA